MADGLSRPLRIALVVSLAFNVFALGAVAAGFIYDGHRWFGERDRPHRLIGMPSPRHLHARLDESHRHVLREAMEAHRPQIRARLGSVRAARQEVADAMRAEPFDRSRLDAALVRLRETEGATAAEIHAMIGDLVARLDAEGRARVAELIPARPRRGH